MCGPQETWSVLQNMHVKLKHVNRKSLTPSLKLIPDSHPCRHMAFEWSGSCAQWHAVHYIGHDCLEPVKMPSNYTEVTWSLFICCSLHFLWSTAIITCPLFSAPLREQTNKRVAECAFNLFSIPCAFCLLSLFVLPFDPPE